MPSKVIFRINDNYLDNFFGREYEPIELDYELAGSMIACKLPGDVWWDGNEIIADTDSRYVTNGIDFYEIWGEAVDEAFDEFCAITTKEEYIATANKYGVEIPEGYELNFDD